MDKKNEIKDNKNFAQKTFENMKEFTRDKAIPSIKKTAVNTKNAVNNVSNKAMDKIKTNITEDQMLEILNSLYIKSVNGIPKVSLPVDDLVEDYIKKNSNVEEAAKSLINNSTVKCGTSGFLTGFGGFATMIATLPANITSVMYIQLRMCCSIAKMAGYDIHSDQVQTLVYACLTGSAMSDILKQAGIKFGQKFGVAMVKKIPGKTITAINHKVGFRFVTKFGQTGIVNLGKVVPVLGAFIGSGIDVASTRIIGYNAYKVFMKGEIPTKEEFEKDIPIETEAIEITDIDTETLNDAINNNVKPEDIIE